MSTEQKTDDQSSVFNYSGKELDRLFSVATDERAMGFRERIVMQLLSLKDNNGAYYYRGDTDAVILDAVKLEDYIISRETPSK